MFGPTPLQLQQYFCRSYAAVDTDSNGQFSIWQVWQSQDSKESRQVCCLPHTLCLPARYSLSTPTFYYCILFCLHYVLRQSYLSSHLSWCVSVCQFVWLCNFLLPTNRLSRWSRFRQACHGLMSLVPRGWFSIKCVIARTSKPCLLPVSDQCLHWLVL
jgi:hypothetical protein